jgi:hypothetical protein
MSLTPIEGAGVDQRASATLELSQPTKEGHDSSDELARFGVAESPGGSLERIVSIGLVGEVHSLLQLSKDRLQVGWEVVDHDLKQVVGVGIGQALLQRASMAGKSASRAEENGG